MPLDYPYDEDATTDFDLWLEGGAPRDRTEAIELRRAVRSEMDIGRYEVDRESDFLVVQGLGFQKLIIASDDAKQLFLQIIHQRYIARHR